MYFGITRYGINREYRIFIPYFAALGLFFLSELLPF
jgi:hypothetical protein